MIVFVLPVPGGVPGNAAFAEILVDRVALRSDGTGLDTPQIVVEDVVGRRDDRVHVAE